MTAISWLQTILYCAIIVALTPVLGGYMTRVFNGERTLLAPVLRPVEAMLYRAGGIDEKSERGWLGYTIAVGQRARGSERDADGYDEEYRSLTDSKVA